MRLRIYPLLCAYCPVSLRRPWPRTTPPGKPSRSLCPWVGVVTWAVLVAGLPFMSVCCSGSTTSNAPAEDSEVYIGSAPCRECHEEFHGLWATSHHGLAMQPYTPEFAENHLTSQAEAVEVGEASYTAHVGVDEGYVREVVDGERKDYSILHVLGGKNVYYFLCELERGRLQTLPVAYDVHTKQWYDMAGSGVRHFPDRTDAPFHWTDPPYTFNTSCHACHVSQLSTNFDMATDTYSTTWKEPGINCETCHGPASEHIRVCREAPKDSSPSDLKLKRITQERGYTAHQVSATCSGCHAKMSPVAKSFELGSDFYNHYDLTTVEHPDFYPDGRDLGENYTYTSWQMSPCVKAGKLDCLHCHTSSGRYRFANPERANDACLPCHKSRVENVGAHTRHKPDSEGSRCVSCHMPLTRFAAMERSDHSMRPPTPATTVAFESPNACTICHTDKDAPWADAFVREWHENDYQEETIRIAKLIDSARKQDWKHVPEMLEFLEDKGHDETFANSLVRLLRGCPDGRQWPVLESLAANDNSPLVRASAVSALGDALTPERVDIVVRATKDPYRLVRVRAAAALAPVTSEMVKAEDQKPVADARAEYMAAMTARPDDWASHYNLGIYYASRGDFDNAIRAYETAIKLRSDAVAPYVNASLAYNILKRNDEAEAILRRAIQVAPESAAPYVNLGMLLGELNRFDEAAEAFEAAFKADKTSAVAAYNLGVIVAQSSLNDAILWCRRAYELQPDNAKYGYTLAFYLRQHGDLAGAVDVLEAVCAGPIDDPNAYALLADIHASQGNMEAAKEVYRKASQNEMLPEQTRLEFDARLQRLESK